MYMDLSPISKLESRIRSQLVEYETRSAVLMALARPISDILETFAADHDLDKRTLWCSVCTSVMATDSPPYTFGYFDIGLKGQSNWALAGELIERLCANDMFALEQWSSIDLPNANCRVYRYNTSGGGTLVEVTAWLGENAECKRVIVGTRKGYVRPELITIDEPEYKFSCPGEDA